MALESLRKNATMTEKLKVSDAPAARMERRRLGEVVFLIDGNQKMLAQVIGRSEGSTEQTYWLESGVITDGVGTRVCVPASWVEGI